MKPQGWRFNFELHLSAGLCQWQREPDRRRRAIFFNDRKRRGRPHRVHGEDILPGRLLFDPEKIQTVQRLGETRMLAVTIGTVKWFFGHFSAHRTLSDLWEFDSLHTVSEPSHFREQFRTGGPGQASEAPGNPAYWYKFFLISKSILHFLGLPRLRDHDLQSDEELSSIQQSNKKRLGHIFRFLQGRLTPRPSGLSLILNSKPYLEIVLRLRKTSTLHSRWSKVFKRNQEVFFSRCTLSVVARPRPRSPAVVQSTVPKLCQFAYQVLWVTVPSKPKTHAFRINYWSKFQWMQIFDDA